MSKLLTSLSSATNLSSVGGKANALSKMISAGFNVPSGFVVPSEAYNTMSSELQTEILAAFDMLETDFVAVRSSAIGEDSKDAAWAGQLDTFLNCTRDNLIEKIQACWDSAHSERALSYAQQRNIKSTSVGVIIQEMIQSEVSGVAFSIHPVSQDNTQVVIEAGFGLGEAIVSGSITPDTYVANKETGQLIEKHISNQIKKLARDTQGENKWVDINNGNLQKLNNEQITELTKLVIKLEDFFRAPVDIEWAVSNNTMYVLQSRPITTLTQE